MVCAILLFLGHITIPGKGSKARDDGDILVPADKAQTRVDGGKIFAVAQERHPILAHFHNDQATEDIIKQYIKNKRSHAYRNEWLKVPANYNYLKANII
ncbi:hypothetical protein B0H13DRAFT_2318808 [Mycena leptocephala]|nr:hypothetical protein B0H13DRAFT_2318808 [Mycena leptocephala]